MATGRQVQLTKQVGEYLVAAELARRGLLTATFAGNVPASDIVVTGSRGQTALVQVKAIAGPSWQFDIQTFVDVRYTAGAQTMGQPTTPPAGDLICVLVRLQPDGADRFYVLRWPELQRVLINGYRDYLKRHGGRRPKRADSFHTALRETHIEPFLDNWSLFDGFTEVSKTDPGTPGGPSAPPSPSRCRPRLGGFLNNDARAASHGPDGSIPDWAARPLTRQATSGSWERGATSLGHEHRRRRGRRTRAPVAASHGRAASPPDRKAGWRASSMTRAACSPSASTGPSGSTHAARTGLARWSVPSSEHGFMVRSADPSNRSGQYCQSRTRVSVSEPLVRRPRGRVEEPSPWSRLSCTFLPGRTVGREHRPTSRSVYVHSAAARGSPHIAVPSPPHIPLPCAAHQSECGRTPLARGHHKEGPSP